MTKNKKAAKNIFNDGDKSFQYPITGISNNKEIGNIKKGYEKSSNLKGINYTWAKDEWGDVEKGNSKKVLFVKKNEYIFRLYFKVQLKL